MGVVLQFPEGPGSQRSSNSATLPAIIKELEDITQGKAPAAIKALEVCLAAIGETIRTLPDGAKRDELEGQRMEIERQISIARRLLARA